MGVPFGTFCSGIGAPEVAARGTDFHPVFFSEIEAFPSAVLAHHWPGVPNLGDFTAIDDEWLQKIRVLVAGTPCQAFSVAGLRRSLDDDRGNLTLQFVKKVHAARHLFCAAWENVPGVLSTKDNAFGCFLGALVGADAPLRSPLERGRWPDSGMVSGPWGRAAWRLLDAQHFGVPQRRKRVILIFCPAASGGDPAAILFEPKGVPGHFAPGGEEGEDVAGTLSARPSGGGGLGTDFDLAGGLQLSATVSSKWAKGTGGPAGDECQNLLAVAYRTSPNNGAWETGDRIDALTTDTDQTSHLLAFPIISDADRNDSSALTPSPDAEGRIRLRDPGLGIGDDGDPMFTLQATKPHAVAFALRGREDGAQVELSGDKVGALRAAAGGSSRDYIAASAVRRLVVPECCRLQGFPDDHTLIPFGAVKNITAKELLFIRLSKPEIPMEEARRLAADGPQYKALGNSMAVPKIRWLWQRIRADMVRCGEIDRLDGAA